AARLIRADHPEIGVVVLSQFDEDEYAFELLKDGAEGLGYLLKERVADVDELVRALQEVAKGGSVLDPKVVERLVARRQRVARSHRRDSVASSDAPMSSTHAIAHGPPTERAGLRRLAWSVWAVAMAFGGLYVLLFVLNRGTSLPGAGLELVQSPPFIVVGGTI